MSRTIEEMKLAITPVSGDVVELRFVTQLNEQIAYNVRHYVATDLQGTGATLTDLLVIAGTQMASQFKDCLVDTAEFLGFDARVIHPGKTIAVAGTDDAGDGSIAGPALPRQTCGLITLRSNDPGGSNRGRMYVPFPSETDNGSGGVPDADYNSRLQQLADRLELTLVAGGGGNTYDFIPVIWSPKLEGWTTVEQAIARPKWATQRRRGSYGKANVPPF